MEPAVFFDLVSKGGTPAVMAWVVYVLMKDRERVAAMFTQLNAERAEMWTKLMAAFSNVAVSNATLEDEVRNLRDTVARLADEVNRLKERIK